MSLWDATGGQSCIKFYIGLALLLETCNKLNITTVFTILQKDVWCPEKHSFSTISSPIRFVFWNNMDVQSMSHGLSSLYHGSIISQTASNTQLTNDIYMYSVIS